MLYMTLFFKTINKLDYEYDYYKFSNGRKRILNLGISNKNSCEYCKLLRLKYNNAKFNFYIDRELLTVGYIFIPKTKRNHGIGSKIINDIIKYANENKFIIKLTPSNCFGSNIIRLIKFYKTFGFKFIDNKIDMYKYPNK